MGEVARAYILVRVMIKIINKREENPIISYKYLKIIKSNIKRNIYILVRVSIKIMNKGRKTK